MLKMSNPLAYEEFVIVCYEKRQCLCHFILHVCSPCNV